jgi:putative ABC transport system substrate-binding protein
LWLRAIALIVIIALAILVAPLSTHAQQAGKVYRIGMLSAGSLTPQNARNLEAFQQGLRDLGWVEGQHYVLEDRRAEGRLEQLPDLATELVQLPVDVIVAGGGATVVRAVQHATTTIPLVFSGAGDPLGDRLVASLAHPGGNTTGVSALFEGLPGKQLEFLKAIRPQLARLAVLMNPTHTTTATYLRNTQDAAHALGVQLHVYQVRSRDEVESAFGAMERDSADALLVLPDPLLLERHLGDITALALQSRLPASYPWRMYSEVGGLMAYAPSLPALYRRASYYVDRLLKGSTPADLPVEQPTKFELVLNLKTAKALGIAIPPTLLFQADEVIR